MSKSASTGAGSAAKRLLSPFAVLMYIYAGYFALVYGRFYRYVYWDLMNLGTRIIGAVPRTPTLLLYAFGAVVLGIGFIAGSMGASVVDRRAPSRHAANLRRGIARIAERLERVTLLKRFGLGWILSLAGWFVAFAANLTQVGLSGGASISDIASRWEQSPVVVFVAAAQILFVPALVVFSKARTQRILTTGAFVVSVLALGVLGARNLPAKLIVATFLASVIVAKPRNVRRIAIAFLIILIVAMGIVGAISKAGIYGASASLGLVVALTYSDSLGTVYNLDKIVALTPPTGVFHGVLLRDSLLSLIPGVDAEYASYQIGSYLGGRTSFLIDGVVVERSVSLAPTMLGAPYADNGLLGVAGQMLILGTLFGYLQGRSRRARWTVPVFVLMASYVINGVNAGIYGPNALFAVALAILVALLDAVLRIGDDPLESPIDEGVSA